ncbi:DNA methyltransferase [Thermoflexibacter ruber]|uniref:site-specific DNA-methyltransferase (adenine-specific) n=1 Tax=Thermoflexibacter ruber TaxID=1003 RepID=A0A1I2J3D0_9BACT|nr:DNA methyltransferase [Thermoflexibacter ruber]SFF48939.1 Type II restriction/modification system, DNA methylase subunit YeeA [Thermoflexibacter ruber]
MKESIGDFVRYWKEYIKGKERQEAQVFLERLFIAFGHTDGIRGAGAECEFKLKDATKNTTNFADLVWKPRCIIEMKKRGEYLQAHYEQLLNYWLLLVPNRPKFALLCNFDEIWIYDFNKQLIEPVERVRVVDLEELHPALSFLYPDYVEPIFQKSNEVVTKEAAYLMAHTFKSFKERDIKPEVALHYCMQCILAMFAQDIGLLPDKVFFRIISELEKDTNHGKLGYHSLPQSYDWIKGLFEAMNTEGVQEFGKFKGVPYFNGGLFEKIEAFELTVKEVNNIFFASQKNWRKVNPSIFGSVFEQGLEKGERHILGAHYTSEADIQKIVYPCIVQPWLRKIEKAQTLDDYYLLLHEITNYKVLDPACGSGNFLFVAFKELKGIENQLLNKVRSLSVKPHEAKRLTKFLEDYSFVSTRQFYGIDKNKYAVELARLSLMIAKEMSYFDYKETYDNKYSPLPLDNLDKNIICADALVNDKGKPTEWIKANAIIGNPPFQSKNKMKYEFGNEYLNRVRSAYPEVNGHADFCVYWFYKAHQYLKEDAYAGLVATNTIRQNYSRESSLDYIVANGGDIFNAVSSQPWEGEAVVHVSIVNWKKGKYEGQKKLFVLDKKGILQEHHVQEINTSLSLKIDVTIAKTLQCNIREKRVFQGQTHGHEGFLVPKETALQMLEVTPSLEKVLKPFLIAREWLTENLSQPNRFVIDFDDIDYEDIKTTYPELYQIVKAKVFPDREKKAEEQEKINNALLEKDPKAYTNKHHLNFFKYWWKLAYGREEMLKSIKDLKRYIVCSRVSKRNIFDFVCTSIRPNDALMVFAFEDDYSYGILQSKVHWEWWKAKCSTLKEDFRYTSESVWETFPFPQKPTRKQITKIAELGRELRKSRNEIMKKHKKISLRDIYRNAEEFSAHPVLVLQKKLDKIVLETYGFEEDYDLLSQILELNLQVAEKEAKGETVQGAGLPDWIKDEKSFVSEDCVKLIV